MSKTPRYAELVAARKAVDPVPLGLQNPAAIENGKYDSAHIGPWTVWANDLDADLMVVGQDWADVSYFTENRGLDKPGNPTNQFLRDLLESVGRPIPEPPSAGNIDDPARATCGVWLTNALLWLKEGGMSAPVRSEWFEGASQQLLCDQIVLVQPRVVVALGERAYNCALRAFGLVPWRGTFRLAVELQHGVSLPVPSSAATLFAVYHCGSRIRNTHRSKEQQRADWSRIRPLLGSRTGVRP
jgi:DNA polymerase